MLVSEAFAGAIKYNQVPGDMCWPGGRVPYVFKDDVSEEKRDVFRLAARAWQQFGNLKFVPTTQSGFHQSPDGNFVEVQTNDLRFFEIVKDVNYAWIGRSGNIGFPNALMQPMSIHNWKGSILAHEMGHMLGFIHEQCRSDRNTYVELNLWNAIPTTNINFDIAQATLHTDYDYDSMMHYDRLAFKLPWLSKDHLTMWAKPPNELKTGTMGTTPNYQFIGDLGTPVGNITAFFSAGDRETIQEVYGPSITVKGKVRLNSGWVFPGVKVELIGNGTDETHFTNLLTETGERVVFTDINGEYAFKGVPVGNYRVKATKAGYTFLLADTPIYTGTTSPMVQDFIVTNAGDNRPPEIRITNPSDTVHQHFSGAFGFGATYLNGIRGTTADPYGIGVSAVQIVMSSNGRWWKWVPGEFDPPGQLNESTHIRTIGVPGGAPLPGEWQLFASGDLPTTMPNATYVVQVRACDMEGNWSPWAEQLATFTIDSVAPAATIDPVAGGGAVIFDFGTANLGGTFTEAGDPEPDVFMTIKGTNAAGGDVVYWNGADWVPSVNDGKLGVSIEAGRWAPKEGVLPPRKALRERIKFEVTITAKDAATNEFTVTSPTYLLTALDTTEPDVAFFPSFHGARYAEHAMPALTGAATDGESQVQGVELYLMRFVPGMGGAPNSFQYWNGEEWSTTPGHLDVEYDEADYSWEAPGLGYRLPAGAAELPDGTYKVAVTAHNRESPQGTRYLEETFYIATAPPRVSITTPAHNGFVKQGWSIGGTATDYSGTGFSQDRVNLTLSSSAGFWNGSGWQASSVALEVPIQPDGTWTYPGTIPGASLPPGETQYALSASVMDRNGNISLPVAGGLAGNNQILFRVDTTPPTCVIVSPLNNAVITQSPLLASSFNGTATDSSGQPQVTLFVKRLSDNYYWTGSMWTTNTTQAIMPGVYAGPQSEAWALQKSFPCLNRYFWGMQNGNYELIAIARDLAGNQTQRSANLVINYNPVWLAPQDLLARVQPKQTAPITSGLGTTQVHNTTPWLAGQPGNGGNVYPVSFTADSQGRYFVTNGLTERVFYGNGNTRDITHGVIQRIGEGAWRRQRTTYSETSGPTINYYEQWSPGGPAIQISNYEAGIYRAEIAKAKTDAAGNTYAAFNLLQYTSYNSPSFYYLSHVMLVKFDADGNLVWRRVLPEMGPLLPPSGWLDRCQVSAIELHADGAVSVVIDNTSSYHPSIYYQNTVVARVSPTGVAQAYTRLGSQGSPYELSAPLYSTSDASGNTYVITRDGTEGAGYSRQVLRKIGSDGSILATLETSLCVAPQYWEALSTDAAGNVYVLSTFELGNDDGRCCVTKYDSSLNQVWRRFGPERSVYIDPYSGPTGGDYRFHVGSQGVTVSHSAPASLQSEYPDAHPLVLRFSLSGDLLWTRAIAKTDTSVYGTDGLSLLNVTPAGDVLFFGWFSLGNSMAQSIYGKISNTGDLQFYMNQTDPWGVSLTTLLPDNRLAALHSSGYSLSPSGEQRVLIYDNPANVAIPVTLDSALPGSRTVASGVTVELKVINRGSAGTYQWRKEDGLGVPQNISGATGDALVLTNVQSANAGRYSCIVTNSLGSATSRTAVLTVLQPTTLDVALDTPGRTWTTGGDLPWSGFLAPSPNRDGVDAAASGSIGDNQSSWVETVVTGPLEVKFWWKISAEYQYDTLSFTVNGTQVGTSISWEQDWIQVTHTVGAGQHTLRWTYARDSTGGGGQNKAWLDSFTTVVPPITVALPEALDTSLTLTTGGNAVWRGIGPTPSHDGVDAAVSGDIGNSQQSWMETTVTGPGTLTYWWKVSSESGYDYLEFYRNSALQTGRISGNVDWQLKTYTIPAGTQTLRWRYMKDNIFDGGLDLAWVDQVVWTPDAATFNSWQTSKFNSTQLADPLISGPEADPNKDGINNLLGFALGLDPLAAGVTLADVQSNGMSGTGPTDHLILTLTLPDPLPGGITYIIEAANSESLSTWTPIATRTSATAWTGTGTVIQDAPINSLRVVRFHDIVNQGAADSRFMRVRVTSP